MDDPSKYIIVRSKDSEVIARYAADSSGKSVLAQVIKKTGSDGYLMQVDGLDVVGDEDEILQAGSYIFTPSAAGTLPWQNPVDVETCAYSFVSSPLQQPFGTTQDQEVSHRSWAAQHQQLLYGCGFSCLAIISGCCS